MILREIFRWVCRVTRQMDEYFKAGAVCSAVLSLPAFFCAQEFLSVADDTDRGHNRLINQHVDNKTDNIAPHGKAELIKYGFLFSVHDKNDKKSEWYHKQCYGPDHVVISKEGQNHAR